MTAPRDGAGRSIPGKRARSPLPEVLSGALAALAYCLGQVLADRYPFGPLTRNINDLAAQLVPMHTLYRDVLTGEAAGDLFLNWNSGLGVPFLPDVATYLGSPLTVLVAAFPRDRIDLALFVLHVLMTAIAAGVMTAYLRRLASGPWLVAAALGAAYGTCGWALDDAGFLLPWMAGLVAVPLFLLVGEWVLWERHGLLGPALVALAWVSNFYTAYMATLGAGALILTRLAVLRLGRRATLVALVRLVWTAGAGVLLAAPLLVPVLRSNELAQPSVGGATLRAGPSDVLARLLPATEGVGLSPGLFATTAALLLAAMFPWARAIPLRARLVYCTAFAAVVASVFWYPTHLLWHGLDVPQGSPYRQAFVLCAWLVVLAWLTCAHGGTDRRSIAPGGVTVVLVALVGAQSEHVNRWSLPLVVLSLVALLLALALAALGARWLLAAVVVLVVAVEGTVTALVVAQGHQELGKRAAWNPVFSRIRDAVLEADRWPETRTTPGAGTVLAASSWIGVNDPMLLGGESIGYYSSHMPSTTSRTLRGLGVSWTNFGRSVLDLPDRGRDAVLGIGNRVVRADVDAIHVEERAAAPLVTARAELPQAQDNPFLARNDLAGAEAYVLPPVEVLGPTDGEVTLVATCPSGTTVHLWAPMTVGAAQLGDGPPHEILPPGARRPGVVMGSGPLDLGAAPGGEVEVRIRAQGPVNLPDEPLACFDEAALEDGITALQESAADVDVAGHSFTATWSEPVQGRALALVPRVGGWACSTGAGWSPPDSAAGFIAVEMQGSSHLACRFRPPGLRLGVAVSAGAVVALVVRLVLRRRRRSPTVS